MASTRHTHDVDLSKVFEEAGRFAGITASLEFIHTPGCGPWWCSHVGAYMPGDPREVEVVRLTLSRISPKTGLREDLTCPDWLGEEIIAAVDNDELVAAIEGETV